MKYAAAMVMTLIAGPAVAGSTINIEVPEDGMTVGVSLYKCDADRRLRVNYINTPGNSLAVLTIGDDTVVTVSVLAASGVKYAGGKYIWWTKGKEADLYDVTEGENAPGTHCVEAN